MTAILATAYAAGVLITLALYVWALIDLARVERLQVRDLDIARAIVDALLWPATALWLARRLLRRREP